jgi:predicted metal-dependent enzyme (double-stranded beta helix superfamily)
MTIIRMAAPRLVAITTMLVLLGLLGINSVGSPATAQEASPTTGSVGITGAVLGAVEPIAAPGYSLEMFHMEWAPGATVSPHTHPMAFVTCVESGALGFTLHAGSATLMRAASPGEPEQLQLNVEAVLGPRDCIAVDNEATDTIHSARNASEETTIAWEADLYKLGEPPTTFVDEQGTPIP